MPVTLWHDPLLQTQFASVPGDLPFFRHSDGALGLAIAQRCVQTVGDSLHRVGAQFESGPTLHPPPHQLTQHQFWNIAHQTVPLEGHFRKIGEFCVWFEVQSEDFVIFKTL